ncbi:hypothetical protein SAMN05446037_1001394 [Anaerovirgula multivorans]|uniref:Uncharacterized protein n=1 Tax=Anaerovirgula multivorans TaxID=312168 RepID=A0A239A7F0_9FIRM|nr:hypothetical protein [Anaerovirgula multivorans]SNR91547.1 hypothetical protein SAMN05446037_1001394 [Anaerovirgula multivorans]
MQKLKKDRFNVSIMIAIAATILVPSNPEQGDIILRYKYGFPFSYITILQRETTSKWFGTNFFTGNMGLAINPLPFLFNTLIIYFIILYLRKIFSKNS